MEVFNKLYSQVSSSVSSTVSHLSGVLPGNPVTREFDAACHIASAGPGLLWKIYKGSKCSTKQEAAIFVLEKRQLEKWGKTDREIILGVLRRGITQLTKIRHPQVLTVQHPLEESRESLAFATEPVFASLANVLGQTTNMPQPANMSDFKLYDIEIKYGLLQISEGLTFLHNDVKLLHKNICPESIIINAQGAWKIFGFDFCVHNSNPPNLPSLYPYEDYCLTLPNICQPTLDYLAPECILSHNHSTASDMFSFGMIAYTLHSPSNQTLLPVSDLQQFRERAQQLKQLNENKLQNVPVALKEYVKMMLNITPQLRPDAHQFAKIPYFDDVGVKTLTNLDSLLQWDSLQKSQFYRSLPKALSKLPQRVKVQRVLPCLVRDLAQPAMIPFVLLSMLDIAQQCNQNEFVMYIFPHLKPVLKLTEPIQILLILLQHMELLLKLTPPADVQQHVLPMLYRGLDSNASQIHELCLSVLPTFAGLLDHANVKNSLLPRIKRLCLSTSSLSIRVNCLLCIGRLLEHLDKWLVLDEILPFLPQIPSREPAVLMGILGIYKLALNHKKLGISKEVISTRILPFLIPLCIENGLTLAQFNALVALVKQMFQLVETEHRTKLEQLNSVQEQQKVLESTIPATTTNNKPIQLDQAFSGLGLDTFVSCDSFSLQEKQRLANQQEATKILQYEPPLIPKPVPANNLMEVKDLSLEQSPVNWSSSLLSSANTSETKNLSATLHKPNLSRTNSNQVTISDTPPINQQWNNASNLNLQANLRSPTQNQLSNNWIMNSNSSWSTHYQMGSSKTSFKNPAITQKWNALDNLLPPASKTPMNQMFSQKQSHITYPSSSSNNNNNNKNSLSEKDIVDLLS